MSDRPMSLNTEPDWGSPQGLNDEPPVDWAFPRNTLITLPEEIPNLSLEDTTPDLQAQLADLQRQLEHNESNENTIERTLLDEQLREEQEALLAELALATDKSEIENPGIAAAPDAASAPAREALIERANDVGLYDARFMGKMDRDAQGNAFGQTLQAIEVYQDANRRLSGKVLDVGYYTNEVEAEQDYSQLQNAIRDGDVPIYAVASMGEMLAQTNGLNATWREAAPQDMVLYQRHLELDAEVTGIVGADQTQAGLQLDWLDQQHAVQTLIAMGLQPPEDFNLRRDSFHDDETGKRYVAGIFQGDQANEVTGYQAALIELGAQGDGSDQQASIVPVGMPGSYDAAERDWAAVQMALNEQGVSGAVQAMEQIEVQISAGLAIDTTGLAEQVVETPEVAPAEPTMTRNFDMDM